MATTRARGRAGDRRGALRRRETRAVTSFTYPRYPNALLTYDHKPYEVRGDGGRPARNRPRSFPFGLRPELHDVRVQRLEGSSERRSRRARAFRSR
jgi:hypothetical protein